MAKRKIKYGKITAVIFLTCLIWVWADLRLNEEFSVSGVIAVAKSAVPDVLVSFGDELSVSVRQITLSGPASKIARTKRQIEGGLLKLEFFLDPQAESITGPQYVLDVQNFLKKTNRIKQLGLTVRSCEPRQITVNVAKLFKKKLTVKALDEQESPIKVAAIEPAKVEMFVPAEWSGEKLVAYVQLTRTERDQASRSAVEKTPYIELAGQIKEAATAVKVTTPAEAELLGDYTITAVTLGITLSPTLQGKYKVEIENLPEVISAVAIRATGEAKRTYEKQRYQVRLEIDDSDAEDKSQEPLKKKLIYNFPADYVSAGEIKLSQQPVIARFKLTALTSTETESTVGD